MKKAFTLVELLIVVIIIAVIAAIAIPKMANSQQRAKETAAREQLKLLRNAFTSFEGDTGRYPASLNDLSATTAPAQGLNGGGNLKPISASNWHGPYLVGPAVTAEFVEYIAYDTDHPNIYCPKTGTALDGSNYATW